MRPELGVVFMSGYSHPFLTPEVLAGQPNAASSKSRSVPTTCCWPFGQARRPARSGQVTSSSPPPSRILVIDDEPDVRRLVTRVLGDRYRCESLSSVEEARKELIDDRFHLALSGIQLPGESGLVLAEEIVSKGSRTAVVLVTGTDHEKVARGRSGSGCMATW